MKILSFNVNGIRAAYQKGFLNWLTASRADIVCTQEIKAQEAQVPTVLLNPAHYYSYFNFAAKKGYSGVGIYTKQKPLRVHHTLDFKRFDQEGRIIKLDYPGFCLINIYIPHGGRGKENIGYKLETYKRLFLFLKGIKQKLVLMGDFNVAHHEIDLARPQNNKNNIMFTKQERKQIDKLLELGFIDSFRQQNKDSGHYTWWPYGFQARQRNIGWRIDYAFISKNMAPKLRKAFILNKVNISDHCPIGIEIV
ncbi:MAG: exodeoxyribonuclease III [Candidatus Brennerbacteria bacterium CG11_big_fil_rev_8_21_14_0_20_43_10]|uniref:Exodeoxyribonuclease III n=3 Tax=Candidatus Brenneribacteriota TaxID=1817902 RepID=A0A2M8C1V7_9BACT|nr:MAG: exodeoxyribonuclease III [Parcubacteria group bacterium CG1_02_44_31]PIP50296.1 MAG: exodeoxyribonuclease III [Candidatus Brennerbacteria bacterium CG23_combo_of_CG06-09_8_20_14_all_44_41]PIR26959.1 MAG: exodeoxyribonuclease III [Candidatus Brennerbacteria bacterium CG11_big_fil_rev_8_21_14_0_20_43_10]PIX29298.1 MAG: exodeoxyribonuclease III [Candidatus Brennerbacteria bacterium CG_4_8_14_3_um_filter_43_14]PJA19128.1 MAG: exodeoxyribonuclease III [Candidatus Brennerbacteria bacterium CG